ncbi:MAG: hypothetical protein LBB11_02025 [Puniceicoccales bacterium]|jgi:RPA family protein|nr:hypothetical protein [Puniceicoccales bacterium]
MKREKGKTMIIKCKIINLSLLCFMGIGIGTIYGSNKSPEISISPESARAIANGLRQLYKGEHVNFAEERIQQFNQDIDDLINRTKTTTKETGASAEYNYAISTTTNHEK